jgi:hypothetical protein
MYKHRIIYIYSTKIIYIYNTDSNEIDPRKQESINLGYPSRFRRKSATSFLTPGRPLESLYAPCEEAKQEF